MHRYDSDGWYCYILEIWTVVELSETDRGKQWEWISSCDTGSDMTVLRSAQNIKDNEIPAKKQGYRPLDEANHIWELTKDGWTSCYYFFENPDGGSWRVEIRWNEGKTAGSSYTAMEPDVNQIMVGGLSRDEDAETADTCTLTAIEKTELAAGGCRGGFPIPLDIATTQQLIAYYFSTMGNSHDWRILHELAKQPVFDVQAQMEALPTNQYQQLKEGILTFIQEYPENDFT